MEILQLYGDVTINSGQVEERIFGQNMFVIINGGNIEEIDLTNGGTCIINNGTINTIKLANNYYNIDLTIGNIDETVNNNNPEIGNIEITTGDLAGITAIINFYNGIVKKGLNDTSWIIEGEYNVRPGYKAQTTTNGTILIKE